MPPKRNGSKKRGASEPTRSHGAAEPIVPRAVSSEDHREAFFARLPADGFSAPEWALREGIFTFLARWQSMEFATVSNLTGSPDVQKARAAFWPKKVSLREWIERRMGSEVLVQSDGHGQDVLHVVPAARGKVAAKYRELNVAGQEPALQAPRSLDCGAQNLE